MAYTSKGERPNVSRAILNAMKRERPATDKFLNIIRAYERGQNPWITIDNPNPKETKARRIRVKTNDIWGLPKERKPYNIPGTA